LDQPGDKDVSNQWRQGPIQQSTEAKNCATESKPGAGEVSGIPGTEDGPFETEGSLGMNTPQILSPNPDAIPGVQKKKRVLLVDASPGRRDLRAETMRKLGMNVDCAADITEARSWWRADLYNLVLINMGNDLGNCDRFCEDMRKAQPKQQLGFLVGKPEYIANEPVEAGTSLDLSNGEPAGQVESSAAIRSVLPSEVSQRWGIMEASRRISEVRSAAHARTQAMRDRPTPPRDSEMRRSKGRSEARTLDDLLRDETI